MALLLVVVLLGNVLADCDLYQNVTPGIYYDIFSPNYPSNYDKDTNCTWHAETEEGYNLRLSCGNFSLPESSNCSEDHMTLWPTEDIKLSEGHVFCGERGPFVTSKFNKLTIALTSTDDTDGGAFLCNITSVPAPTIPVCNCGWKKQTRIVGGAETGINEYPMMAGLIDKRSSWLFCGADIISSSYVLTAGHCVDDFKKSSIAVLVGAHDLRKGAQPAPQQYEIADIKVHPKVDDNELHSDIALVKVDGPIAMSEAVMPVCLPFRYASDDFTGKEVTLLGWGSTKPGGSTSKVLMQADVTVTPIDQCKSAYADQDINIITSDNICTYGQGKDICQGDSGGPVLWYNPSTGREYQIGIINYGLHCNSKYPSVHVRVTSYLNWISGNTADDDICKMA